MDHLARNDANKCNGDHADEPTPAQQRRDYLKQPRTSSLKHVLDISNRSRLGLLRISKNKASDDRNERRLAKIR
jgi:hypothetical protein